MLSATHGRGSHQVLPSGIQDADIAQGLLSSATIRSEMGVLEDEGFLEQPHISPGLERIKGRG